MGSRPSISKAKQGKLRRISETSEKFLGYLIVKLSRGWVKKKYTNSFKSGGNILDQSASKC